MLRYKPNISWQDIAGTIYIVEEISSCRYKLNDISKEIWILLDGSEENDLINEFILRYPEIDSMRIHDDVHSFIADLITENLVEERK